MTVTATVSAVRGTAQQGLPHVHPTAVHDDDSPRWTQEVDEGVLTALDPSIGQAISGRQDTGHGTDTGMSGSMEAGRKNGPDMRTFRVIGNSVVIAGILSRLAGKNTKQLSVALRNGETGTADPMSRDVKTAETMNTHANEISGTMTIDSN